MSMEKSGAFPWKGIKAGAVAAGLTMALLWPAAMLIEREAFSISAEQAVSLAAAGLSAAICAYYSADAKGEGAGKNAAALAAVTVFLYAVIGAAAGGGGIVPRGMIPAAAVTVFAVAVGTFVKINKKYSRRKRKQRRYNR